MIKAVGTTPEGHPMILLGLSAKNIEKLKEGKPILVELSELGLKGKVAIVYGETEDLLARDLEREFSISGKVDKR